MEEVNFYFQLKDLDDSCGTTPGEGSCANAEFQPIEKDLEAIEKGLNDVMVQLKFLTRRKGRENKGKLDVKT